MSHPSVQNRLSLRLIYHLRNHSRSGWLCARVVNSGGKPRGFLHQSTREHGRGYLSGEWTPETVAPPVFPRCERFPPIAGQALNQAIKLSEDITSGLLVV